MKKILALVLAAMMVLAMIACSGSGTTTTPATTTTNTEPTKTETSSTEPVADAKSYQLVGVYEEEGANASMLNAAFLLNLNADGTVTCDRYQFSQFNAAPAAENPSYEANFMTGTWKPVTKDGVDCLQIKIAVVNDDGTTSNDQTAYAYEIAGEYSFDLTFPIVKGMSYSRTATMAGGETKNFADADAFIAAYKKDFVAPDHIAAFVGEGATAYLTEDGAVLIYLGVDQNAEGKWSFDGALAITIGGSEQALTVDGNKASFTYSVDRGDGNMVDYNLTCEDISVLGSVEVSAPAEDAPYTGATIDLGGNTFDPSLVLNADGTAVLTVAMGMNVKYEKVGNAVVLSQIEDAPLEGYAATIFSIVPNAWLLDEESKTMTGLKGAWTDGMKAFYAVDETTMTVALPAYGMSADGFTYEISEDGATMTVTAPAELSAGFTQVWGGAGVAKTFTIDGVNVTEG